MGLRRIEHRAAALSETLDVPASSATVMRRTATILVTDLVGSTQLRVAVGEEAADALRGSTTPCSARSSRRIAGAW